MTETLTLYIAVAFAAGALAVVVRLPPLVGFLIGGFVLQAMGAESLAGLEFIADLGVTLLLFAVGLKLDPATLLRPQVWLTTVIHLIVSVILTSGLLWLVLLAAPFDLGLDTLLLLGLALSFSSTVFVIKILDTRRDNGTLYGRLAIGVLVMQDIVAVVFITASKGEAPSPWAFGLVGVIPLAFVMRWVWNRTGDSELHALFGIMMAVVPGYFLFDLVGLKGDLGALVIGALLASHHRAPELARTLLTFKELLLVAFFLSIGLTGPITVEALVIGLGMLVLIPVQALAYVGLLVWQGLRYRTALLTGLALANYSEFALIVVSVATDAGWVSDAWLVTMAVTVSASFVLAAVLNNYVDQMSDWLERKLPPQAVEKLDPEDRPIDVSEANALVLGMGRVGRATFEQLREVHQMAPLGVEHDLGVYHRLQDEGLDVVQADATDRSFWERVCRAGEIEIAVLAMPFHGANIEALEDLRRAGFTGRVAAVAQRDHEVKELEERGAEAVFNLYGTAGTALADSVAKDLD